MKHTNTEIVNAILTIIKNADVISDSIDVAFKAHELEKQNKKYKKALKFYADERHIHHELQGYEIVERVNDNGEVARHALEETK